MNNSTSISGHQVATPALVEQAAKGKGEDFVVSFNTALQSLHGWGKVRSNFALAHVKPSIALKNGIHMERWSYALSIMLEKMHGCSLMSKLRVILLMKADFNFSNKIIYGFRMMDNARKYGIMPEEIYSEKNKMADNGTLVKVLFFDIARQTRLSAGLSSVDAANCYDAVAHAVTSLTFQVFGVPEEAVQSMLSVIEEMKYFLDTTY